MLPARRARPALSLDFSNPETPDVPAFDPPSPDKSPEQHALRLELGTAIQRGLDSLPQERRLAVTLIDVQGLSYEEGANVMNCSLGTVKSRVARGRAEMRDFLRSHRELLPDPFRQDR